MKATLSALRSLKSLWVTFQAWDKPEHVFGVCHKLERIIAEEGYYSNTFAEYRRDGKKTQYSGDGDREWMEW